MKPLPWDSPRFLSVGDRVILENPPFPPAIDASIEVLELGDRSYMTWTPGVSLHIRTDNGYEMTWQELERDDECGVIRFGVP